MHRRQFLHGVVASLPFFAGCSDLFGNENDTPQQTTNASPSPTLTETDTQTARATATADTPTGTAAKALFVEIDSSQLETYTNSTYGYSVKYPVNWSVDESDPTNVGMQPSQGRAFMGVVVEEDVPSGTSLDVLVPYSMQILNDSFDSFDKIGQQAITLPSGQDAKIVDAHIRDASFGDFVVHGKYSLTLAKQRGYMVQTYVLEQNYPSVKQALTAIVKSLTIE